MKLLKKTFKWMIFAVLGVIVLTVGVIFAQGYVMYKDAIALISLDDKVAEIRSADSYCEIEDISPDFLTAIVSIEDKRFYTHSGIDMLAFSKAFIKNLVNMQITGGGSTITQQLAKNMYFTMDQTFTRKVAELLVAFDLERNYEKEDILELYLNIIYFGCGQNGIKDACEYYFECLPSEMTFDQVLFLAGIPQAPSIYSVDSEKADQRAQQVLEAMIKNGYDYQPENT